MQNRRNFLKQASLMLAGGLVAPQLLSSCGGKSGQAAATASESSKYIGLQLYSLNIDKLPLQHRSLLNI